MPRSTMKPELKVPCPDCGKEITKSHLSRHRAHYCRKTPRKARSKQHRHEFSCPFCPATHPTENKARQIKACMGKYVHHRSSEALKKALGLLEELKPTPGSRLDKELDQYKSILRGAEIAKAVTADKWRKLHELRTPPGAPFFVVCSSEEAREILQRGTPNIPLLVLQALSSDRRTIPIKEYLTFLRSKESVDVHYYDTPSGSDQSPQAVSVSIEKAIQDFCDQTSGPLNFLNLHGYRPNEVPECLLGLDDYSILRDLRQHDQSGKGYRQGPSDLTSCISFQILGKAGVFSMPHIDHHGVLTTVYCEEGEKLWMTWPQLEDDEFVDWMENGVPTKAPFPIHMQKGDLLIQPPGTVHAPFSLTSVLMSGTMHWDSRQLIRILKQSILEKRYPDITNEDPAKEFLPVIKKIESLWKDKSKRWSWPSDDQEQEFSLLIKSWKCAKRR